MKKILLAISLAAAALACPEQLSAKQTLEEATDSIKTIYRRAQAGDSDAQTTVGHWYYIGRHVDKDYATAAQWWAKAAKANNNKAIGYLALCYQTGRGVQRDSIRAFNLYSRSFKAGNDEMFQSLITAANKGNVSSQMFIAQCYKNGIGVDKDPFWASKYYDMAAQKGSADACRELGVILLNNKQATDAARYFKMGAERNDLACTFYYGMLLCEGKGVKKDTTQGVICMQKAADAGFANAQLYLGKAYYDGVIVRKSPETGYSWLLKAARNTDSAGNGPSNAMYLLAMKEVAGDGCPLDYDLATDWFGQAVARGHSKAFRRAFEADGDLYQSPYLTYLQAKEAYGKGDFTLTLKKTKELQKSKDKAISATGTTLEGLVLCNKNYEKRDLKKGAKQLQKAVDKGNAMAMYLLGAMYESGTGVDKDAAKSHELFTAAAKLGNPDALCYLGNMLYEGRGVKQDFNKAVKYYLAAGPLINATTAKHLAACYENGYGGLKIDKEKAKEILNADYSSKFPLLVKLIP